jgi:hypothetical protein
LLQTLKLGRLELQRRREAAAAAAQAAGLPLPATDDSAAAQLQRQLADAAAAAAAAVEPASTETIAASMGAALDGLSPDDRRRAIANERKRRARLRTKQVWIRNYGPYQFATN